LAKVLIEPIFSICAHSIWGIKIATHCVAKLSRTYYRLLLRVEKPEARAFYEAEAVNSRWSTREIERQINFSWNWGKASLLWRASNA
jgi:hypothetical protein